MNFSDACTVAVKLSTLLSQELEIPITYDGSNTQQLLKKVLESYKSKWIPDQECDNSQLKIELTFPTTWPKVQDLMITPFIN